MNAPALPSGRELSPGPGPWPRRVAWILAVCTFGLLIVGGLVTTYRVGMAVHDWPTTFGRNMFSYPLSEMRENWGVTVEHSHRMFASCVGLLTIAMVLVCAWSGGRWAHRWAQLGVAFEVGAVCVVLNNKGIEGPWAAGLLVAATVCFVLSLTAGSLRGLRALAVATHLAVIGQGLLGGTRVLENSQHLAFLHGAAAQVVYVLVGALLVTTSRAWWSAERRPAGLASSLRRTALLTLAAVYAQIVLGAWLRHSGRTDALFIHLLGAVIVPVLVILLARRLRRAADEGEAAGVDRAPLRGVRRWLVLALVLQILLGALATLSILFIGEGFAGAVTVAEAVTATLHVAVGAVLFSGTGAAVLWSFRIVTVGARTAPAATMKLEGGPA